MRRTTLVGTAVLASLLWLSPLRSTPQDTGAAGARPAGTAATARTAGSDGPADAAGRLDATAVAAGVEERVGDRYGGYWIDRHGAAGEVTHVNVVEPTAVDRLAAARLAGDADRVEVHDAEHSYEQLIAGRDAVASSLDRAETGDFAVGLDVPGNGLTVETERGDADATRLVSLAAVRQRSLGDLGAGDAAAGPAVEGASGAGDATGWTGTGPASGAITDLDLDDIEVDGGADIGLELLGAEPTTFPPYEAGLHLLIPSGTTNIRCTSGFSFANAFGTYGSTAGHCARRGESVRVGNTAVDTVSINPFETATQVPADAALYSLSAQGWPHEPVLHGGDVHRRVVGSLTDSQIGNGLRLCFDGRTSGIGNCGTVNAASQRICCDSGNRSFVFSCITRPAQSGDSGGPVYQAVGSDRARAAGILSSSVTVAGQRSMCFSTVGQVERATGTRLNLAAAP